MRPQPQEIQIKTHIGEALPRLRYEGPYKQAIDVAEYYGFRLIQPLHVSKDDRECTTDTPCPADRVSLLRAYLEKGMDGWAQPVQLCHTCKVPYQPVLHFRLESIGSRKSAVEALLMHTAYVILKEHGYDDVVLAINSVGGSESMERYTKELTQYYKQHLDKMDEATRAEFMNDVFAPLRSKSEECLALNTQAPRSVAFLTEASRQHFAEVLECLETFDIPYYIKDDLVGATHYTARTIFEFQQKQDQTEQVAEPQEQIPLAYGERYDRLARHVGLGRRIPAVGITIDFNKTPKGETIAHYKQKRAQQEPLVYVVQVGLEARRSVLAVTERLRQARIPIALSFSEEKLAHQIKHAEHLDVAALVIIGQKEISDGTAIIRNRNTRVQKIVSQNHLPSHLKRLCSLY